ncbi:MAG: hypothetical protein AAFX92_02875 [Pseudomonadota bacterium]
MSVFARASTLGVLFSLALPFVAQQAHSQTPDALDQLRAFLPSDSALAFGERLDGPEGTVLEDVVVDLIWRSSRIRADRLLLATEAGDLTVELDGVVLRNASGSLAADSLSFDANAAAVLRSWAEVEAPNEDVEENEAAPADETDPDLPPGNLSAKNLTIRTTSQPPTQGWFVGDVLVEGLTSNAVERLDFVNLVAYAAGRFQAGRMVVEGIDIGWFSQLSGVDDIVGGRLPEGGVSLMLEDMMALDASGRPFFEVSHLRAFIDGEPAPAVEAVEAVAGGTEEADEVVPVGRITLDFAVDDFALPIDTLRPLPIAEELALVAPETLSGSVQFAGTIDGPGQRLLIETGLIDLADVAFIEGSLDLADVSFAPDAPQMPLALIQLPGSIPMFSIAGGRLDVEDHGLLSGLEAQGVPPLSATVDSLSTRLSNRLPMLSGRLDGILAWLRAFESDGRGTVRIEPATPAPVVELLSLMLINPDGVADRLGLSS